MSEAIEFGIGGNNKSFVAVMTDTEQKAKQTGDKVKRSLDNSTKDGLKSKGKITQDLQSITAEFKRATSIQDAFGIGMSRLGAMGGKLAGPLAIAAAFAEITRRIVVATDAAAEFQERLRSMERSGRGGVTDKATGQLEADLSTIQEAREANKKVLSGEASSRWGANFFSAAGRVLSDAMARTGASIASVTTGEQIRVMSPAERDLELKKFEEKALERIAQKQREIFAIEQDRISGATERAQIAKIEAEYAERIGDARRREVAAGAQNLPLTKQLTLERDELIAAVRREQGVSLARRVTTEAVAAMGAGDAQRAVGMSAEEEQRQAMGTRVAEALFAEEDAKRALEARPNDPDLQTAYNVAIRNTERVTAEVAKWERDIARSKGDSVKAAKADNDARAASLRGQQFLADSIRIQVANELAIVTARRAGNEELAKTLERTKELERKDASRRRVMDGDRVMTPGEVRDRERQAERTAKEADRTAERLEASEGRVVARVGRSPRSRRVLGIRSKPDEGSRLDARERNGGFGSIDFAERLKPRGINDMLSRSGMATTEMQGRTTIADVGMNRKQKEAAILEQKSQSIQAGNATPEQALGEIAKILKSWSTD